MISLSHARFPTGAAALGLRTNGAGLQCLLPGEGVRHLSGGTLYAQLSIRLGGRESKDQHTHA